MILARTRHRGPLLTPSGAGVSGRKCRRGRDGCGRRLSSTPSAFSRPPW